MTPVTLSRKPQPKADAFTVRRLDSFPTVAAAAAKLEEIKAQRQQIEQQLETTPRTTTDERLRRKAEALATGQPEPTDETEQSRAELRERIRILELAEQMAAKTYQEAAHAAAAEIEDDARDEHRRRVRAVLDTIREAQAAVLAERWLVEQVSAGTGHTPSLVRPMFDQGTLLTALANVKLDQAEERLERHGY